MRIWTDDEYIEVDPNDVGELEAAMLFKSEHIKAKADPELFAAVAYMLSRLWDSATKRVDVVRCRECHCYTPVDEHTGKCVFLIGEHQYVVPDGYCYLGERKEGDDNEP